MSHSIRILVIGAVVASACRSTPVEPPRPPVAVTPAPPPIEIAAAVSREDRYPRVEVRFANGVRGIPDLVYAQPDGHRPLALDLYLPPASATRPAAGFPLVVQIHGGAWLRGDKRHAGAFVDFPDVLARLAGRGYVVASIEYRLSGEAKFPAQAHDVKLAIRWLRANAATYGIDPSRAVAWGASAGAHLAALAALSCHDERLDPVPVLPAVARASDCVQAGVAWFGVYDMRTIREQAHAQVALSRDDRDAPEWQLLGCFADECPAAQLVAASPIAYADRGDPPMLLIAGDADTTVPHLQTLDLAVRLEELGAPVQLIVLRDVNHSLIAETPEQTREANLEALAATFAFIDRTMGRGTGSVATR